VSIYNAERDEFVFKPGPIFANVVLADEINRTTPRTQSALLEAMNDFHVSVDSVTHRLPLPFMVIATQNPIEYHGTYPLPESQMDRFLLRTRIGYPDREDEKRVITSHRLSRPLDELAPALTAGDVLDLQDEVKKVRVDESITDYILSIAEATRRSRTLEVGVSPRGCLMLSRAAQARAVVEGRDYCTPDDVKSLAIAVLSHRVIESVSMGVPNSLEAEDIMVKIIETVEVPL
jgi:MoxR-like ATPase